MNLEEMARFIDDFYQDRLINCKSYKRSSPNKVGEIMPTIADSLREQGLQQEIIQNARESVIDNLEVRFEIVPQSILKTLNEISDSSILKILRRKAVKVKSVEEFGHVVDLMMK